MRDIDLTKGSKSLYEGEDLLGAIKIDGETIKKAVLEDEDEEENDKE